MPAVLADLYTSLLRKAPLSAHKQANEALGDTWFVQKCACQHLQMAVELERRDAVPDEDPFLMLSARAWPFAAKYSRHNVKGPHAKLPLGMQPMRVMVPDDPL